MFLKLLTHEIKTEKNSAHQNQIETRIKLSKSMKKRLELQISFLCFKFKICI